MPVARRGAASRLLFWKCRTLPSLRASRNIVSNLIDRYKAPVVSNLLHSSTQVPRYPGQDHIDMAYGLPDWLTGSSTPEQPAAPKTRDGGRVAPDRNSRELCYESRDIFFECLDKNNVLDAIREDEKARTSCPQEVADYERDCARSWVCRAVYSLAWD